MDPKRTRVLVLGIQSCVLVRVLIRALVYSIAHFPCSAFLIWHGCQRTSRILVAPRSMLSRAEETNASPVHLSLSGLSAALATPLRSSHELLPP
eukprot:6684892-Lingulodinium_polyedra.AAC.1